MLQQIKPLLHQQLVNLFGINVLRHTRDPRAKRRGRLMAGVWTVLILIVCLYVGGLSYGLAALGAAEAAPSYLIAVASLLIFFFGTFTAGGTLYSRDGYEILCSLPLSRWAIVASRFARMYAENLLLTCLILLPGMGVYAVLTRPAWDVYAAGLLAALAAPLVPVAAASIVGAAVAGISSRMKHKALVEAGLSIALVLSILLLTPKMAQMEGNVTPEMLAQLSETVLRLLRKLYPPAVWLGCAVAEGDVLLCIGLLAGCLAAFLAVGGAVALSFHGICRRLFSTHATHSYKMGRQRKDSVLKALCVREFRRYFSSGVYVSNTIIGPIMATAASASVLFLDMDQISRMFPIPLDIPGLIPFLAAGIFCMMSPSSVSVSMEGNTFWIVKSLPISGKMLLDAKILMNLLLCLPFYLASEALLIIALKPDVLGTLWLVLIPGLLIVFSCVWGVAVNLRFPVLDWENEVTVVKQSASAMLGGMGGFLVSLVCLAAAAATPAAYAGLTRLAICAVLAAGTAALYRSLGKVRLNQI